jgi:hypothetical protein
MAMADQPEVPKEETEQARVERVRYEERKRHAERTAEELRNRYGIVDED